MGRLDAADLDDVLEGETLALGRSDLLEYCPTAADPGEIGGLDQLKSSLIAAEWRSASKPMPTGCRIHAGCCWWGPQGTGAIPDSQGNCTQLGHAIAAA